MSIMHYYKTLYMYVTLTKVVKPSTVVTVMYYQGSLTEGKAPCTK